jgi:hypothetical protein
MFSGRGGHASGFARAKQHFTYLPRAVRASDGNDPDACL